jgi:hypothetical protein
MAHDRWLLDLSIVLAAAQAFSNIQARGICFQHPFVSSSLRSQYLTRNTNQNGRRHPELRSHRQGMEVHHVRLLRRSRWLRQLLLHLVLVSFLPLGASDFCARLAETDFLLSRFLLFLFALQLLLRRR